MMGMGRRKNSTTAKTDHSGTTLLPTTTKSNNKSSSGLAAFEAKVAHFQRKRSENIFGQFNFHRHMFNIFLLIIILFCVAFYHVLLNQENKIMMVQAHSAKTILNKPHLIYGTAWKKGETARYVSEAVKAGFRFIDTACQPKHYNEPGVGNGWTAAAQELNLDRSDIWLQTKFTSFHGQDPNKCPYDPKDPVDVQVRTSLKTSLNNLHTDYLDSWVMHSPYETLEETMVAWRTMEEYVDAGKVRQLGMSNCYSIDFFKELYAEARHKPKVLQNRFYSESNFDTELRQFCKENDIHYQSFWTLGANRRGLEHPEWKEAASNAGFTPEVLMFAFLMSLGYINPLSGTKSPLHMNHDVAIMERMQGGEVFFENEAELRKFAHILGMPDL